MRGIAALLVAVYHFQQTLPAPWNYGPTSYLAVDFFLMLSGFVIAKAYESRLKTGLTFAEFVKLRVIRLYPLFLAGLALGILIPLAKIIVQHEGHLEIGQFAAWLGANMVMLPALDLNVPTLFPFNPPAWSLFFEILINLVFACVLIWMPRLVIALVAVIAAIMMSYGGFLHGSWDLGWGWAHAEYGLARTVFGFAVGMLAFRMGVGVNRRTTLWTLGPMLVLAVTLAVPVPDNARVLISLIVAIIGFPILLWIAAGMEPPKSLRASATLAGDISYPIYILHYPIMGLVIAIMGSSLSSFAVFLVVTIAASYVALKFYDEPVRRLLSLRKRVRQ